jgi:hypothetical protein
MSLIFMGSSSNNFFAHYVTQFQSHSEKIQPSGKTRLGNFNHAQGKPVAREKLIQATIIRLGKTPCLGKTKTSDFSKTKGKPARTVPVTPCSVQIFLHDHASKKLLLNLAEWLQCFIANGILNCLSTIIRHNSTAGLLRTSNKHCLHSV